MHQEYVEKYLKQLVSINNKVYPHNISFIDAGCDSDHGGVESQKLIARLLFDFIKNNDS